MRRLSLFGLWLVLASAMAPADARLAAAQRPTPEQSRQQLLGDVRAMNAHPGNRPGARDVLAGSERLRSGFRALGPHDRGLGSDERMNQELARLSFAWLSQMSGYYRWDPQVAPDLMRTYGYLGGVYRGYPAAYQPWLWTGYAGANRLARSLVMSGSTKEFERSLEQFALELVALNVAARAAVSYLPSTWDPAAPPPMPAPVSRDALKPVPLPDIDEAGLSAAERETWADLRLRFRAVSARVHEARLLLEELSSRLSARNLALNTANAATAVKMQGFLEDSVELARRHDFEKATEALVRADYERNKLKGTTGQ